ncbi:MAG: pseudouridylate synthase [Candidatus Dactylopiibacterium carminicum]|uniref:tRNA pseudouridine synthase C n=1 Tax=Candidatus Dactylopiibacterium carminicum TaxID=857335 RepID=A0A272EPR3_9RHOO|nr:pseudouridylate synthase [Candidatus Dactylopiibacterium carminicum]PAS92036.1 MAG: pseudouridylate synthase [Candidatus Dactylopiibacterium carminicum]PAS95460.1 MAG: pseudouridylate synthase [Candidatus Dactylopiibacterium carminicum]PAS97319.1 MAG: pseudouridylate synthase [Candidatus Dactylopiibacterium carminicum]
MPILYRDDHLVAVHKPSGLLVHRSELDRHETLFAVQLLRQQIGQWVWPVHRLDRGTSGVLLFALDRETLALAGQAFETREVLKEYLAVVRGWPEDSGSIDHPLKPDNDPRLPQRGEPYAQAALTRYETLARMELPLAADDRYPTSRYALVRLHPETGRRHQLRRHLKHISHPIIGDATHGKGAHNRLIATHFGCHRMLLACTRLELQHPRTGEQLLLQAAPDGDFERLLARLGWSYRL